MGPPGDFTKNNDNILNRKVLEEGAPGYWIERYETTMQYIMFISLFHILYSTVISKLYCEYKIHVCTNYKSLIATDIENSHGQFWPTPI